MYTALIIGVVGLLIWAACSRLELGSTTSDIFFAAEHKAREKMTRAERALQRHEMSSANRAVRFFKSVGIGCSAIGFGRALLYAARRKASQPGLAGDACIAVIVRRILDGAAVRSDAAANCGVYRQP
jgi:hypothetical protein